MLISSSTSSSRQHQNATLPVPTSNSQTEDELDIQRISKLILDAKEVLEMQSLSRDEPRVEGAVINVDVDVDVDEDGAVIDVDNDVNALFAQMAGLIVRSSNASCLIRN